MGTAPGGMNPPYFLNTTTVWDDGAAASLVGGAGTDLFFKGLRDQLTGVQRKAVVVQE
jgi:hypothetical protein